MKLFVAFFAVLMFASVCFVSAQRGYFDAPYKRYEADSAVLSNGAVVMAKSYAQADLQSEASNQVCVDMKNAETTVEFAFSEAADGLVIRYSVPDGESAVIGIYNGNIKITSLTLTSKWSWEYLWNNGDPNNVGITNKNPRMRFDEVRTKLPEKLSQLKIVKETGNLTLDFIEMEPIPGVVEAPAGAAVFNGDGSKLQAFIDENGGKTIYIPEGVYHINSQLYFGVSNTKLHGAGMWYTQLNFTVTNASNGGLRADASDISYSDLYLTSEMTKRTNGYGGIIGVYTSGSVVQNIWVEHCATGSWIGQYGGVGPVFANGFLMKNCRFRNTYADGINLCKGTSNAIVEHCNFRNNGDDAMAIWCADGLECINNTFRNNTAENGWRAAGSALYGGKDNKFYDIIIKDNIDVGITVTNTFQGIGFNAEGMHDFHNITLIGCGTFNATYNDRVGAINITHASGAGAKVENIRLYNIDILDSKCDAIRIAKNSGQGIFNLVFENININGTGKEYPLNNVNNYSQGRGYAVIIEKFPLGSATYCNLAHSNLGGNSNGTAFNTSLMGTFSWTAQTGCDLTSVSGISLSPSETSIAGGATIKLSPVFTPSNVTNRIVNFTSDNVKVATVSYDGVVTGLAMGKAVITVTTLDGNFSASCNLNVTRNPAVVYRIKNRWQNTYLYDAGDRAKYGINAGNNTFLWKIEEINGVKEIQNYSTGDYLHIENLLGYVQCTSRVPGGLTSKWTMEDAGEGFIRLKSELNKTEYIHIENLQSHAQYGSIVNTWWSAMWSLEPVYLVTSVADITLNNNIKVYPNPSQGNFKLTCGNVIPEGNITITIYNLAGQVIFNKDYYTQETGRNEIIVNTGNKLLPGSYYILIQGKDLASSAKLVICR